MKYAIILVAALAIGALSTSAEAYRGHGGHGGHSSHVHKVQYKPHQINRQSVGERHPESGEKLGSCYNNPYQSC
jgi:hypothetical protein